jgi:hypothetical protein
MLDNIFGKSKIDKDFKEVVIKGVKKIADKQEILEKEIKKLTEGDTIFECIVSGSVDMTTDIEKEKYQNFRREIQTMMKDYGYHRVTASFMKKV